MILCIIANTAECADTKQINKNSFCLIVVRIYDCVKMGDILQAQMRLGDINAVLHAAHEIYVSFGRDEHWRISKTKCVFNVEGRCAKQLTFGGIPGMVLLPALSQ